MSKTLRIILAEPYSINPPRLGLIGLKQAIDTSCVPANQVEIIGITDQLHQHIYQADILVFSISNPIEFESVFNFLSCAKLPIERRNRTSEMPLIVAGGMGLTNPEPMGEYFDMVVIGASYKPFLSLVQFISEKGKDAIIRNYEVASHIAGLYIPALTEIKYAKDDTIRDLTNPFRLTGTSSSPLQTYANKISENEAVLMPDVGCKHNCSYCALSSWFEYNAVSLNDMRSTIDDLFAQGVTQIKINSASASQHSDLIELLEYIRSKGMTAAIGSVRIDEVSYDFLHGLFGIHRLSATQYLYRRLPRNGGTSLTFGIECGSDRLLQLINKSMTLKEIKEGIARATQNGITNIGEYFIIGIPTEQETDLRGIVDLILFTYNCVAPHNGEIFVNISPLIPTPNTPMQRVHIPSITEYNAKLNFIKKHLQHELGANILENSVHIESLPSDVLLIETIAFRGDRRMGKILVAISDGASESDIERELQSAGLPDLSFFRRRIPEEEIVPWQYIMSDSVRAEEKEYLKREKEYE